MGRVSPREGWDEYAVNGPEGLVVVTYSTLSRHADRTAFTGCARVITPCGPADAAFEKSHALEEQLIALLEHRDVPCILVGTLRYGAVRELVFQVADWDAFRPAVGAWFRANPGVELDVTESEGWDFFEAHVWPHDARSLFVADRDMIQSLVGHGTDTSKPHLLEYLFSGPEVGALEAPLIARGYHKLPEKSVHGQLVMAKSMPLDVDAVFRESQANDHLARHSACRCDGWGAHVVK